MRRTTRKGTESASGAAKTASSRPTVRLRAGLSGSAEQRRSARAPPHEHARGDEERAREVQHLAQCKRSRVESHSAERPGALEQLSQRLGLQPAQESLQHAQPSQEEDEAHNAEHKQQATKEFAGRRHAGRAALGAVRLAILAVRRRDKREDRAQLLQRGPSLPLHSFEHTSMRVCTSGSGGSGGESHVQRSLRPALYTRAKLNTNAR